MIRVLTFLVFILLTCLPQTGWTQRVTVSEELSMRSDDSYKIIGKMKNRFLLFRFRGGDEYVVQAFDEKLRMSWKKEIALDKKNPRIIEVLPQKDNFVVFYQYRQKGKSYLKAAKYDPAANLLDSVSFVNLGSNWYSPKFESFYSEDRTKIVLSSLERQSYFQLYAFDINTMELIWENKIRPDRILEPNSASFSLVDNQGNFYFVREKYNRKARLEDHRLEVYKAFGSGEANRTSALIQLNEFLFYDLKMIFDNRNNKLIGAGLYSANSRARANGVFTLSIDNGVGTSYLDKVEFEDNFINGVSGRGVDEEKGISEIDIRDIVLRRNGGAMLLLERNRILERRVTTAGRSYIGRDGSGYIVDYYYDDVLALSIDPEGKLIWNEIFHKRQYSQDDNAAFSSYFILKTPSELKLVFNDDIKNETTVSEYVIKANGTSDRNAVFSTEAQNLKLRFKDALQVGSNEMVVPSERRNRLKLVLVSY